MTPEERQRAGAAVAARIEEMHTTTAAVARAAGIDRSTIQAIINGDRWPRDATRARLAEALGWPHGELIRQARDDDDPDCLERVTTRHLAAELAHRLDP